MLVPGSLPESVLAPAQRPTRRADRRTTGRTARRRVLLLPAVLLPALLAGCAAAPSAADDDHAELTILAAASLTDVFTELAADFTVAHPGITVNPISFDGSATLATQLIEGAPADLFASADQEHMQEVADLVAGVPVVFATNTLQLAVAPGNPLGIMRLSQLAKPGLQVVLCESHVPCGAASHRLLARAGVTISPVSEEQNVRAVLTKVRMGEADAGLVYLTDVASAAGAVDGIELPQAASDELAYSIAVMERAASPSAARAFIDYLQSPAGQATLAKYGFGAP